MIRMQIQLPDELYRRAKRFATQRELSLAELTRQGLQLLLAHYPDDPPTKEWRIPTLEIDIKVPLEKLHDFAADEETRREAVDRS